MIAHPNFLKSRLSQRIGIVVFCCSVAFGGILFLPAHSHRQKELLNQLENTSREMFATVAVNQDAETLFQNAKQRLQADSVMIKGMTLYDCRDGRQLYVHGNHPVLAAEFVAGNPVIRQRSVAGNYYDVSLPQMVDNQYLLVVRHDLMMVHKQMLLFSWQTLGVVLLLAAGVTVVLMVVLERLLISPIVSLQNDLRRAGEAICRDQVPQLTHHTLERPDELGDVSLALQQMAQRVSREMRDRKQAEAGLRAETEKSERLLLNILPAPIAAKLKNDPGAIASRCPEATIMFADIVGYTKICAGLSPGKLVRQLNAIFSTFDFLAERYGLEKIKTIGDAYMVVGGLTTQRVDHVEAVLEMALDMQQVIHQYQDPHGEPFKIRIGINTGAVVAGVIGLHKFSYDLWGDAVNIASRMESHGLANQIQVSEATYNRVKERYAFESRGAIELKGRGTMNAYILVGHKSAERAAQQRMQPQYNVEQVHALTTNLLAEVTQVSKLLKT